MVGSRRQRITRSLRYETDIVKQSGNGRELIERLGKLHTCSRRHLGQERGEYNMLAHIVFPYPEWVIFHFRICSEFEL